jgi:hypothetical protein
MYRLTDWKTYILLSIPWERTRKNQIGQTKKFSPLGSFGDMKEKDYEDFVRNTRETRNDLFNRDINLGNLHSLTLTSFPGFFVVTPKL